MKLEYLKGSDNKVADALSHVSTQKLDEETVTELLNCARTGSIPWAETANIHVIEEGKRVDQEVIVRYTQIVKQHKNFRNLANQDWVKAQSREPIIPQVIKWIQQPRDDRRKLEEYLAGVASDYERCFYATRQKEFTQQDNLLYLQVTPTNSQDTAPVFVVPAADQQAAIDGCHRSAGHQGRDYTLSLVKERFWWPGMSQALLQAIANCGRCIQYEAKGQLPPMQPIICTELMELVHIVGGGRSLYPICTGIHYQEPYGEDNSPSAVQQLFLRIWFSPTPHVRSRNGILREGHCGDVQPAGSRKDPYYPISPSNKRISQESTPDSTTNDRQTRSGEKKEVASPHRINYYCLQLYKVPGDWVFPVLPYVRVPTPVTHRPIVSDASDTNVDPYN